MINLYLQLYQTPLCIAQRGVIHITDFINATAKYHEYDDHMAYLDVQSRAVASCCVTLVFSNCAISGTSGSLGFGSVRREHTDKRTLEIVSAGDHWSFRMSKQIPPLPLILQ